MISKIRSLLNYNKGTSITQLVPGKPGHRWLTVAPAMQRDALGFFSRIHFMYGDFAWYSYSRKSNAYLVSKPDYIEYVLSTNYQNYTRDVSPYKLMRQMLGDSILTTDGDIWKSQRQQIQPAFNRQDVKKWDDLVVSETLAAVQEWYSISSDEHTVSIDKEMKKLTLSIAAQLLLGKGIRKDIGIIDNAFSVINEYITALSMNPVLRLFLKWPLPWNIRYRNSLEKLELIVYSLIESNQETEKYAQQDLLSLLTTTGKAESKISDKQLFENLLTLLLAGYETTSNALTWTWYLLSKHPEEMYKLQTEISRAIGKRPVTADDLHSLKYPELVIQESMRLYPPIWAINRRVLKADRIGCHEVAAGDVITLSPYITHRDSNYWRDPEKFMPERFMPEYVVTRPRFSYFPFGGGPRQCVARHFAMLEAQLILVTVIQHCELQLDPNHKIEPQPLISLRPKYGLPMSIRKAS